VDKLTKYMLITLTIIILLGISFKSYYPAEMGQTFFSLADICYTYEGYKNYPKIIGRWSLGALPRTLTINANGRIISYTFAPDRTDVDFTLGHGSAIRLIGTTCNAEGQCVNFDEYVFAFSSGEFNRCYDNCVRYNTPALCSARQYMPIPYNCYNLCAYDGGLGLGIDSLKPSKSYTITVKEIKMLRYGRSTWETTYNYAIDIVYSIIYDPNDKPWERICNPGEKKNFGCNGNYKVWDECSPDGKSWFTNREYCNYGCFNGGCNQYTTTNTTIQPIVQPQPIQPNTTSLSTQEQPQPTFDYRLIVIIIGVILVIVISVFLLIRGEKYG
jgi:hypothetical protein